MAGKFASLNGGLRRQSKFEEEDPTSGLTNLADCMLVLACGLMVALIMAYDVDMTVTEMNVDNTQEISDIDEAEDQMMSGSSAFIDMGRLYQDPETGKYYMIEESEESE